MPSLYGTYGQPKKPKKKKKKKKAVTLNSSHTTKPDKIKDLRPKTPKLGATTPKEVTWTTLEKGILVERKKAADSAAAKRAARGWAKPSKATKEGHAERMATYKKKREVVAEQEKIRSESSGKTKAKAEARLAKLHEGGKLTKPKLPTTMTPEAKKARLIARRREDVDRTAKEKADKLKSAAAQARSLSRIEGRKRRKKQEKKVGKANFREYLRPKADEKAKKATARRYSRSRKLQIKREKKGETVAYKKEAKKRAPRVKAQVKNTDRRLVQESSAAVLKDVEKKAGRKATAFEKRGAEHRAKEAIAPRKEERKDELKYIGHVAEEPSFKAALQTVAALPTDSKRRRFARKRLSPTELQKTVERTGKALGGAAKPKDQDAVKAAREKKKKPVHDSRWVERGLKKKSKKPSLNKSHKNYGQLETEYKAAAKAQKFQEDSLYKGKGNEFGSGTGTRVTGTLNLKKAGKEGGGDSRWTAQKKKTVKEKRDKYGTEKEQNQSFGDFVKAVGAGVKEQLSPAALAALAETGFEVVKGGAHEGLRLAPGNVLLDAIGVEDKPFDFRRSKEMLKAMDEQSPVYGFAKTVFEGGSADDAAKEFGVRLRRNPDGIIELVPIAGGVGLVTSSLRAGGVAGRVQRPGLKKADETGAKTKRTTQRELTRERIAARKALADTAKRNKAIKKQNKSNKGNGVADRPLVTTPKAANQGATQFYSRGRLPRTVQKATENVKALVGKDPFVPTKFGRKLGEKKAYKHSKRGLEQSSHVRSGQITKTLGATTVALKDRKTKAGKAVRRRELAAIELLFDDSVRRGSEMPDLLAVERHFLKQDGSGAAKSAALVRELREDLRVNGEKSLIMNRKIREQVSEARQFSHSSTDALVKAGHINREQADFREQIQGAIARGSTRKREKGEGGGKGQSSFVTREMTVEPAAAPLAVKRSSTIDGDPVDEPQKVFNSSSPDEVGARRAEAQRHVEVNSKTHAIAFKTTPSKPGERAGYLDPLILDTIAEAKGKKAKDRGIASEDAGKFESGEGFSYRELGRETVKESLLARERFSALQELKVQVRRLGAREGQVIPSAEVAGVLKSLGDDYIAIKSAAIEKADPTSKRMESTVRELGEPAGPGDDAYVVPKSVAKIWRVQTKPAGKLSTTGQWVQRHYISAVLPFSVLWQAGNVADLTTRVALAGAMPGVDNAIAKSLSNAMRDLDPRLQSEIMRMNAHLGAQDMISKGVRLKQVTENSPGAIRAMGDYLSDTVGDSTLTKTGALPKNLLFKMATTFEEPFVNMAQGRVARLMGKELGIQTGKHVELGHELARRFVDDPELARKFGEQTLEIIGDYSMTPRMQRMVGPIDPFFRWMQQATKMVAWTLPTKHPIKLALGMIGAGMAVDAAERLGLDVFGFDETTELLGLPLGLGTSGFSAGAVGAAGGFIRPISPFTSFGEFFKLLESPVEYGANRVFPYAQGAGSAAIAGKQPITRGGTAAGQAIERRTGIDIPGNFYAGDIEGANKFNVAAGNLVESFVPGASGVQRIRRGGGFPAPDDTLFNAQSTPGTRQPLRENNVINPFGRVKKPGQPPPDPDAKKVKKDEKEKELDYVIYNRKGEQIRVTREAGGPVKNENLGARDKKFRETLEPEGPQRLARAPQGALDTAPAPQAAPVSSAPSQPSQSSQTYTSQVQGGGQGLAPKQQDVLTSLVSIGKEMGVSNRHIKIGVMTGLVEQNLSNDPSGHLDSVGWRQERQVHAGKSVEQRMDLDSSIRAFYGEVARADKSGMTEGQVAQAVQRSAYPERYDERSAEAQAMLARVGTKADTLTSSVRTTKDQGSTAGKPDLVFYEMEAALEFMSGDINAIEFAQKLTSARALFREEATEVVASNTESALPEAGTKKVQGGSAIKIGSEYVSGNPNLTVTSTTGGKHTPGSFHYSGRAIDIGGTPEELRKMFLWLEKNYNPTEMFYDPMGRYHDNGGVQNGAIGGHGTHIHFAL